MCLYIPCLNLKHLLQYLHLNFPEVVDDGGGENGDFGVTKW